MRQAPMLLLVSKESARQAWGTAWQALAAVLELPLDKAKEVILKVGWGTGRPRGGGAGQKGAMV